MTPAQEFVLTLLQADTRRDVYEGQGGGFWVTYTGDIPRYEPLAWKDIHQMIAAGALVEVWKACFTTPHNLKLHQAEWARLEETRRVRKEASARRAEQRLKRI